MNHQIKVMSKAIIFLVVIFSIASCGKEEMFSCDPEINDWVVKNKVEYADVSRDELAKLDYDKQIGLFASFSPEQKVKIFQSKFQYLMGLETLSDIEKEYLTRIFSELTINLYFPKANTDKFIDIFDKWNYEVIDKLGWEKVDVFRYTHTWLTDEEFEQWYWQWHEVKSSPRLKSTRAEKSCDCYASSGCPGTQSCEKKYGCIQSNVKCGPFISIPCDGYCD